MLEQFKKSNKLFNIRNHNKMQFIIWTSIHKSLSVKHDIIYLYDTYCVYRVYNISLLYSHNQSGAAWISSKTIAKNLKYTQITITN